MRFKPFCSSYLRSGFRVFRVFGSACKYQCHGVFVLLGHQLQCCIVFWREISLRFLVLKISVMVQNCKIRMIFLDVQVIAPLDPQDAARVFVPPISNVSLLLAQFAPDRPPALQLRPECILLTAYRFCYSSNVSEISHLPVPLRCP